MGIFGDQGPLVITFGILGNIISLMVYLSPLPTFINIIKKKTTEKFQSVPYVVALFSSMLWISYALFKQNQILLITINAVGCVIEIIYIALFITYAPKYQRVRTFIILAVGIVVFSAILLPTKYFAKGAQRVMILGCTCIAVAASVYVAPLFALRRVIRTRSVEFMPFWLSFFLGLSAAMWLLYGLLLKDFYIMVPNVFGLVFAGIQMVLYIMFKFFMKRKQVEEEDDLEVQKLPNNLNTNNNNEIKKVSSLPKSDNI